KLSFVTFIRRVLAPDVVIAGLCAEVLAVEAATDAPEFAMSGNAEPIVKTSHPRPRASKTREPKCSSRAPSQAVRVPPPTPDGASLHKDPSRRCISQPEA